MEHLADFSQGSIVKVHTNQFEEFKINAERNSCKKRYRLCLHESPDSQLHEMIICRKKGSYDRPHKHSIFSETHTIIDGQELIVIFSEHGEIQDAFMLDRNGGMFCYRVNPGTYHTAIVISDYAYDFETRLGPFSVTDNTFAAWVPDYGDAKKIDEFLTNLEKEAKEFLKNCGQ